jgi:hypothetical protein
MNEYIMHDIEYDLMCYCLKKEGKWWANHFFYNKSVRELYFELRKKSLDDVFELINGE